MSKTKLYTFLVELPPHRQNPQTLYLLQKIQNTTTFPPPSCNFLLDKPVKFKISLTILISSICFPPASPLSEADSSPAP